MLAICYEGDAYEQIVLISFGDTIKLQRNNREYKQNKIGASTSTHN